MKAKKSVPIKSAEQMSDSLLTLDLQQVIDLALLAIGLIEIRTDNPFSRTLN
jgi:hypothetical protein